MKNLLLSLWAAVLVTSASLTPQTGTTYTMNFDVVYFGPDVAGNAYYMTFAIPVIMGTSTIQTVDAALATQIRTFATSKGVTVPATQIYEFSRTQL